MYVAQKAHLSVFYDFLWVPLSFLVVLLVSLEK